MFRLIENFKEQNDNRQSHAFIIEKSSDLAHMHAHMGDDGYYLDGPGNKYILRTPKIHDFTLSLSVRYTMLTNKDTNVRIHYGYDRRTRKGYALEVEWKLDGTAILHLQEIDSINILQATFLAMERAMAQLAVKPELALIDGNREKDFGIPVKTVVQGDSRSASIAAASVLAKVTRDDYMLEMAKTYPQYGFEIHKGYGTKAHYAALAEHGPCPIHRMSFLKKLYGDK